MSQVARDTDFLRNVVLDETNGLFTIDDDGRIVYVNDSLTDLTGLSRRSLFDKPAADLFESGTDTVAQVRESVDNANGPSVVAAQMNVEDDAPRPVTLTGQTTEHDGTTYLTVTVSEKETRADERPAKNDRLVRQLFDHRPEPLFVFDPDDGTVVACNQEAKTLLGVDGKQCTPQAVSAFVINPDTFTSFLQNVTTKGDSDRESFKWRRTDGSSRLVEVFASPIDWEGQVQVLSHVRDAADQHRLKKQRRRRTAALDALESGIAILDEDLDYTYVNATYASQFGFNRPDDIHGVPFHAVLGDDARFESEIRPVIERDGHWHGRVNCTAEDTSLETTLTIESLGEDSFFVSMESQTPGTAANEPSQKHREELAALTDARDRLSAAKGSDTVAQVAIDALVSDLGYDLGCLRYHSDQNTLDIAAMSEKARELVEAHSGFEFAMSAAGRAFRTGERVVQNDSTEPVVADVLPASVHYPLGDHGVLTVATREERSLTSNDLTTLQFFAGGIEVALDRLERQHRLQEQRTAVQAQRKRLETIADIAAFTQDVITDLLTAESPERVKSVVCRKLAAADIYEGALIAELDAAGKRLQVSESEGISTDICGAVDGSLLSDLADQHSTTSGTANIAVTEVSLPVNVRSEESESVVITPMTNDDRTVGILAVQLSHDTTINEVKKRSLSVLSHTVSFALSSLKKEELLLSDKTTQLEFQVTDPSCLSVALSDELDTHISMKRTVRNAHDEYLSYVRIEDTRPEAAIAAAESMNEVRDCRVINHYEDDCLVEIIRESSGAEVMLEFGATMRTAEAESGRGTLVIEAPHTVDIRRIAQEYQTYNPQSELLNKQQVNRPVKTAEQLRADIENKLTDKQRSALVATFYSGYYEWPRDSNAEEIAESMGITASTLHQHLRRAHKKILSSLLVPSQPWTT
jgi:PAS domain S-box-containing protein